MNVWDHEINAEHHRQQLLAEASDFRLQKIAYRARVYHPGLFERTMFNFANWMISAGKQLRKRYEVPTVNCSHSHTESFAH